MKIIICSSMIFSEELIGIREELLKQEHQVILPAFVEEYAQLESPDEMHKESAKNKIEHDLIRRYFDEIKQGDAVLIINKRRHGIDNYIGGNVFLEMGFAHILNKKIFLLNPIPDMGYADEIIAMKPAILNGNLNLIR